MPCSVSSVVSGPIGDSVHVHVALKSTYSASLANAQHLIKEYLCSNYVYIPFGTILLAHPFKEHVIQIYCCSKTTAPLQECILQVYCYVFHPPVAQIDHCKVSALPSESFHGIFSSLVLSETVTSELLHYALSCLLFAEHDVQRQLIPLNHLLLLHGPPGILNLFRNGKNNSLSRACSDAVYSASGYISSNVPNRDPSTQFVFQMYH